MRNNFLRTMIIVSLSLILLTIAFGIGKNQSETIILESIHNPFVTGYLHEDSVTTFTDPAGNFVQLKFDENHQVNIKSSSIAVNEWIPINIPYVFGNDDNKVVITYTGNGTANIELWWNAEYWYAETVFE